jgi:Gly-Xaa carboxypeptidase
MAEKMTAAAAGRRPAAGSTQQAAAPPTISLGRSNLRSAAAVGALAIFVLSLNLPRIQAAFSAENSCLQPAVLTPTSPAFVAANAVWQAPAFTTRAVDWLSGAIRIETESYDDAGAVGQDDRWAKFAAFHTYLEQAFPRTHAKLALTKVNTYGLVYEWVGSDPSLKPVLFAAHQGRHD